MREREGLGFTEGDGVGQKNLCGRGGPLIKFTAPGFKGVKVKTPFGGTGHQTMVVGIRKNKFRQMEAKFYTSTVDNSHDDDCSPIQTARPEHGLIESVHLWR